MPKKPEPWHGITPTPDLSYDLPPELIAQEPVAKRDGSRMMRVSRGGGRAARERSSAARPSAKVRAGRPDANQSLMSRVDWGTACLGLLAATRDSRRAAELLGERKGEQIRVLSEHVEKLMNFVRVEAAAKSSALDKQREAELKLGEAQQQAQQVLGAKQQEARRHVEIEKRDRMLAQQCVPPSSCVLPGGIAVYLRPRRVV